MIRNLELKDLPRILAIEHAVHLVPWTRETFDACFQSGYLGWVSEDQQKLNGFIVVSIKSDECHVLNVCVDRPYQRQGYGRKLLEHALSYAKAQQSYVAYLEVRRSNLIAIALYKKMQFRLIGERKNYYPAPMGNEDALIFAKSLT